MNGNDFDLLTFKEWKKRYIDFVDAQLKEFDMVEKKREKEPENITVSERYFDLEGSIEENKYMLDRAEIHKDAAIFYKDSSGLGFKALGKTMLEDFKYHMREVEKSYV